MDLFALYPLPAIIFALLGVCLLVYGSGLMYNSVPDGPKYSYSVGELEEPPADSDTGVIQFTDLSETGQKAFLESLNQDRQYQSNKMASEVTISDDYQAENYVEYQNQTYVFIAQTNYSGWWIVALIISGCAVLAGLVATLLGVWFVRNNKFKLPTAAISGILALGLLRLVMLVELIEQPPAGFYDTIGLLLLPIPVLIWYLLWRVEWHWGISFSQRMDR